MNDRVDGRAADDAGREGDAVASQRVSVDEMRSCVAGEPGRRRQLEGLLDMLGVLDSTMGRASRAGDAAGVREVSAARVACWIALADLAESMNPGYALACRSVARREHQSAVSDRIARSVARPSSGAGTELIREPRSAPDDVVGHAGADSDIGESSSLLADGLVVALSDDRRQPPAGGVAPPG